MESHCSALKPFCPEVFGVELVGLQRRAAVTLESFTDPSIEAIENFILRKVTILLVLRLSGDVQGRLIPSGIAGT